MELTGRGRPFGDIPLPGRLTQLPCLWYRYKIEQRGSKDKWKTVDSGESSDSFLLRDDTGDCVVDPEYAEIVTKHRDQWQEGDYRVEAHQQRQPVCNRRVPHTERGGGIRQSRGTQCAARRMEAGQTS